MGRGRKPVSAKKPVKEDEYSEGENTDHEEGEDNEESVTDAQGESTEKLHSTKSCRKIMIVSKEIDNIGWDNIKLVTLLHPKTQQKTSFLIDTRGKNSHNCIFEIMTMEQETRSWFVDDSVISDGNIYVATVVDPLFFIVPAIMKSHQAMPLRDHLTESIKNTEFEDFLTSCLEGSLEMENVSEKKVLDDIVAFKYSEERTVEWLAKKVDKVSILLQKRGISSSESAVSANFAKSANTDTPTGKVGEEYLRYACDIVSEYIDNDLKKLLYNKFKLSLVLSKALKRKGNEQEAENGLSKKIKTEGGGNGLVQPTEDYGSSNIASTNSVNTKLKAKDKELQKAAKGSQSLFKFFTPKAK